MESVQEGSLGQAITKQEEIVYTDDQKLWLDVSIRIHTTNISDISRACQELDSNRTAEGWRKWFYYQSKEFQNDWRIKYTEQVKKELLPKALSQMSKVIDITQDLSKLIETANYIENKVSSSTNIALGLVIIKDNGS